MPMQSRMNADSRTKTLVPMRLCTDRSICQYKRFQNAITRPNRDAIVVAGLLRVVRLGEFSHLERAIELDHNVVLQIRWKLRLSTNQACILFGEDVMAEKAHRFALNHGLVNDCRIV
jgi:hypothetical protein